MKKEFLTKKSLKEDQIKKEKAIVENFAKTFNSIKRINEDDLMPDQNDSSIITVGKSTFERTGKFKNIEQEKILNGAWPSDGERPTENNLKPGLMFYLVIREGGGLSRTAFVREDEYIPYVIVEETNDSKWVVGEKDFDGVTYGTIVNTETGRGYRYKTKEIAQSQIDRFKEFKCEELKKIN
jgi:hypothetical protein